MSVPCMISTGVQCVLIRSLRKNQALVSLTMNIQDEHARVKDAKTVSRALTKKASEMQEVTPYRTMKCGEPPIRLSPL